MYRFLLILTLIGLLGGSAAYSGAEKPGSIDGRVVIKNRKTSVPGAKILLKPVGLKTQADESGYFHFDRLKPAQYLIIASKEGFSTAKLEVEIKAGQSAKVIIEMIATGLSTPDSLMSDLSDIKAGSSVTATEEKIKSNGSGHDRNYVVQSMSDQSVDRLKKDETGSIGIPSVVPNMDMSATLQSEPSKQMPFHRPDLRKRPKPNFEYEYHQPADMFFRDYGTNSFVRTRHDPYSTFALDVDDGSFNIVSEYLNRSALPPRDAVRVEEFINHFDYGYADPRNKTFRLFTELTRSPFDRGMALLKIGVKGKESTDWERLPLNLTFVIDISGSMQAGNRLGLVKQSMRLLLDQLDGRDRVGIVAYGSTAVVMLDPTSAENRKKILKAIYRLEAGGSTFAEAGLKLGFRMANSSYDSKMMNRVILCSDGVANVGKVSPEAIFGDITEFAKRGITLSTFGYGMGNYNDMLLEQLAIKGDGQYAYVNDINQAEKLFVRDFVDNMALLARDAKIQVHFDPHAVESYRLLGYENRAVADNRFRDNSADGGEIGPGHEITALYELKLTNYHHRGRVGRLGMVALRWSEPDETEITELNQDITGFESGSGFESARAELRLAVVAARFAEVLKRTRYVGTANYEQLLRLAMNVDRDMGSEQSAELVDLIDRARNLDSYRAEW